MTRDPEPMKPTDSDASYLVGLFALTVATGLVDAVIYLALDHVFTGNMTGNVLFVGFGLAGPGEVPLLNNAVALVGFLAGAIVAGRFVHGRRHVTRLPTAHLLVLSGSAANGPRDRSRLVAAGRSGRRMAGRAHGSARRGDGYAGGGHPPDTDLRRHHGGHHEHAGELRAGQPAHAAAPATSGSAARERLSGRRRRRSRRAADQRPVRSRRASRGRCVHDPRGNRARGGARHREGRRAASTRTIPERPR